ncbi:D-glycerate dehydrogenase [Thalassobacillus devorans]|uniref:D-glycerate dehydrogenase n=1 Tax=Thalassobacillus devorans TaxID=279813 RepID=A0ABQ1NNG3_9BACI|nr:D-glycerate dehydrogenase [Thalassobacillus devorans]NIK29060.1 glyoxylate reductase [Thalassobacillus devorans]GGC81460.1 D-glycerate dehydrogenase [Thalassobacillus devorans]
MAKPKVFIARKLPDEVVEKFKENMEITMWDSEEEPVDRTRLLQEAGQCDGLITMLTDRVDDELMDQGKKLKIIANMAVGYDNVDIQAADKHGIQITNTPDVLTETTADLTFTLLMAAARRIIEANEHIKEGKWENWSPLFMAGTDVHHKSIGIVGMGRIGQAVARRAKGFGMEILYHNRSRKEEAERELGASYHSFDDLLEKADYVVCLAPLTEETRGMFNQEAFKKMKSSAIFVNASRGALVDERALYEALVRGEVKAAGLDVFEKEPIDADHPLLGLDQVVCLPHIGSASTETRTAMMELCLENTWKVLNGEKPKTPVN